MSTRSSLFRIAHNLPDDTALYGESFQMLSQTAGTLGKPVDLGYDELAHYKIPQPADAKVVTGMMTLTPPGGRTMLLAFTSCRRFNGRFYLRPKSIEVVLDTEGLATRARARPGNSRSSLSNRARAAGAAHQAGRAHRSRTIRRCSLRSRPPAGARGTASARVSPRRT